MCFWSTPERALAFSCDLLRLSAQEFRALDEIPAMSTGIALTNMLAPPAPTRLLN